MKKAWFFLLLMLGAFLPAICGHAAAEDRKLTLMVYMCGSNLESEYGSASADIREMESSGFAKDDITVLVMMGGSKAWEINPDSDETVIMEIAAGRHRIVWRSGQLNMGSQETLTQLLDFGKKQYPADDYALILWDHGGGPLEGVCWDELFSMDSLTLKELTEGIRSSLLMKKLCWIGFDACLMGSAEVASAVAPYAEYMIASQETEPAAGWNYAFLKDATRDGAATGRRIIDCYFEALADSRDPLTMACVDLSKVDRVVAEMDAFFPPINESVSEARFAKLSRIRAASSGFGKSVRAVGVDGYDLVDLTDLITRYGGEDTSLMAALGDAVIYSRSKNTEAGGLSVYHPYENKKKYLESWQNDYRLLNFSAEYNRYLEHFGAILTGESYVDWSRLSPEYGTITENGEHIINLQLTEEQAADYLSGEMLTMVDFSRTEGQYLLAPISASPVSIDENGCLTAGYSGRALYAVDANGKILQGPISYMMSDDGEYYVILAVYRDYSTRATSRKNTGVLYYCKADPHTGDVRIVRSYVYDDASQTYTNRIAFVPDGFTDVEFRYFTREMPNLKKPIPGFDDWRAPGSGYMARDLKLPCDWRLRFVDEWNDNNMYAVFQITDTRQNRWSSLPIQVSSPREKQVELTLTMPETEGIGITCSATIHETTLYPRMDIEINIRNNTDKTLRFSGSPLVLNGTRTVNEDFWLSDDVEAGEAGNDTCTLTADDLTGLSRIRSVDFTLSVSVSGDYDTEPVLIPVHLELENGELAFILSDVPEPLDEYADGDIVWQLISIQQEDNGDLTGMIRVQNHGDTAIKAHYILMVNGMQTRTHFTVNLEPGTDAYYSFKDDNRDVITNISLSVTGNDRPYVLGVNQALQQAGILVADRLEIYPDQEEPYRSGQVRGISLRIPDGIVLQEPEAAPEQAELLTGGDIHVTLDQVLVADNGIGLGLRLENNTDKAICLKILEPELNGTAYDTFGFSTTLLMPSHTGAVRCISLKHREFVSGMPVESMSFVFQEGNRRTDPVVLRFPDRTRLGTKGGILLDSADVSVTAVTFDDKPMALSETAAVSELSFHPLSVTAPMTPEEAERLDYGGAYLCILTRERSREPDSPEYLVTRNISGTSLEKTGDTWTAVLSGIAVMAEDYYLATDETRLADNTWQLKPDRMYFYPEAGSCQPTGEGLWNDGYSLESDGGAFLTSDSRMKAEITDGQVAVSDFQVSMTEWSYDFRSDNRTNRYLDEISEAAVETRVFFGTDRLVNYQTIDYSEAHMLSLKEPVTLTLVPAETLEGDKCLYYALFFTDGSRKDILQDLESGEILEETFTPAE